MDHLKESGEAARIVVVSITNCIRAGGSIALERWDSHIIFHRIVLAFEKFLTNCIRAGGSSCTGALR